MLLYPALPFPGRIWNSALATQAMVNGETPVGSRSSSRELIGFLRGVRGGVELDIGNSDLIRDAACTV